MCITSGGASRPALSAPSRSAGSARSTRYSAGLTHEVAPSRRARRLRQAGAGPQVRPLEVHLAFLQQRLQHGHVLAQLVERVVEVDSVGAHRGLGARSDAEPDAPGREPLQRERLLRERDRMTWPCRHDRGAEQDAVGPLSRGAVHRQRVGGDAADGLPRRLHAGFFGTLDLLDGGCGAPRLDQHADALLAHDSRTPSPCGKPLSVPASLASHRPCSRRQRERAVSLRRKPVAQIRSQRCTFRLG
jgi:hypothetical protein